MRAWRWFVSQGPIIVAFVLLGVAAIGSAAFQVTDEANEARHDRDQQAQIDELRAELRCHRVARADADRLADRLSEVGWPALADRVLLGDESETRQAAERIGEIARELGPAADRRAESVDTCRP